MTENLIENQTENQQLASDDELILALAAGTTVAEAAQRAGVAERTVYRRLKEEEFQEAVSEVRSRAFDAITGQLIGLAANALGTLERLANDSTPSVALRASKTILELIPRLLTFTELQRRITALEAEERKSRSDDAKKSESGEVDVLAKAATATGSSPGRIAARVGRLETQRAERKADGQSVAEEGTARHEADATDQLPAPCANPAATPSAAAQDAGTKPPSQKVAENVSKSEIRWR